MTTERETSYPRVSDRLWLKTDLEYASGCPGCVHWHAYEAPTVEEDETGLVVPGSFVYAGHCKRYPPVHVAGVYDECVQPSTTYFDRCGEWKGGRKPCSYGH